VPERGGTSRDDLVQQDNNIVSAVKGNTITNPKETGGIKRVNTSGVPKSLHKETLTPLVVITGVKYSGKSTLVVRSVGELKKEGLSSVGIDSTGRLDYEPLVSFNSVKLPVIKGEDVFKHTEENALLVHLYNRVRTSYFLNLLSGLISNRMCVFCETDMEDALTLLSTYRGVVQVVLVMEYDFTKLRDTANSIALGDSTPIHLLVNNRENVENPDVVESTIRRYIPQVNEVSFMTDIRGFIGKLGVS
jgi:hypothetical protein